MIDPSKHSPVSRQCELLELNRSTFYYQASPVSSEDLAWMRHIDEMHLARPFYGSRRTRDWLQDEGHDVNGKRVQRLMRQMGIMAVYPKLRTTRPGSGHKIYPYLLRGVTVHRPKQVWAADIYRLSMARGFLYLVAIVDWHSRKVLAWRVSNTLESNFCVEALEEALRRYGASEIFNTGQGAQFTSGAFTDVLKDVGVAISMDGKGHVFVERLWCRVNYEEVYLYTYATVAEARAGLRGYFRFYNVERRNQSLNRMMTPDETYAESASWPEAA